MKACGAALRGLSREALEAVRDGRTDAPECEVEMAALMLAAQTPTGGDAPAGKQTRGQQEGEQA